MGFIKSVTYKTSELPLNVLQNRMDPRWKYPFTCVIAGPTGSGWTQFVTQFLNHVSEMMTPLPQEIVWCYGEWQHSYNRLKGVTFAKG